MKLWVHAKPYLQIVWLSSNLSDYMYDIIGSGIAGLTCSQILSKSNISHSIFEKETSSPEDHYGIQITPNASNILAKIGLFDTILPDMHVINNIEIISLRNLKTLTRLPVNEFVLNNNLSKYFTISRKILYEHLLNAVNKNGTVIENNKNISNIIDHGDHFDINYDKNDTKESRGIIIASGSSKKPLFKNILIKQTSSNYLTLRAVAKKKEFPFQIKNDSIYVFLSEDLHIVAYPFFEDKINIVVIAKKNNLNFNNISINYFKSAENTFHDFLNATNWTIWNLNDYKTKLFLDKNKPIFVIGDAAHTIKPHLAQGASMAIEDAYSLAVSISNNSDPKIIHDLMEKRNARIKKVIRRSSTNRLIFHAKQPVSYFRDIYLRNTKPISHLNSLKWLYNYEI